MQPISHAHADNRVATSPRQLQQHVPTVVPVGKSLCPHYPRVLAGQLSCQQRSVKTDHWPDHQVVKQHHCMIRQHLRRLHGSPKTASSGTFPCQASATCQAFGALSTNQPSRCLTPHFANRSFSGMDRRLLGQARHGSASTTRAVRATVQRSSASLGQLRHEQGIDTKTVAKWQKRVDGRR